MNDTLWLDYSFLQNVDGNFSKLFCDYISDFHKVKQYFEFDFHSLSHISSIATKVNEHYSNRQDIVDILIEQNKLYQSGERTFDNIETLKQNNTFAIVTGQQVGLLGGPLYTFYKIITTLKLKEKLQNNFPQYSFVPIFWLEGEDHDFDEVNKTVLLNSEHNPIVLEYLNEQKSNDNIFGPVGDITFDLNIISFYEQLQKTLPNSEFKSSLFDLLRSIYTPGSTFNLAFVNFINHHFKEFGIIFISSNCKRVKHLLSKIFIKEIQESPRASQLIIERSAELETSYHAQIKPRPLNLFYLHNKGRLLIEPRENDFSLKGVRQHFQKDELLKIANENPELLSPNVALRPICQDTVLPTIVYVGGPSECAYFAQLQPVYRYFEIPMPIIYPRASVTLLEAKHERIMEKYEIDIGKLFTAKEKVFKKIIDLISEVNIEFIYSEASHRLNDLTNEMKWGLNYIDPTLVGALETTRSKIESLIQTLKAKTEEAQKRKHEIALRQIQKVINTILPNNNFQERELNIVYFMNKYGLDFSRSLYDKIIIDKFQHQIISIH